MLQHINIADFLLHNRIIHALYMNNEKRNIRKFYEAVDHFIVYIKWFTLHKKPRKRLKKNGY